MESTGADTSGSESGGSSTSDAGPVCGDGQLDEDEECDDGNINAHDECLNSCEWAFCGDGEVWDGVENCDDGNNRDDDGCPTTCDFARCGDGFVQLGVEECDDANDDPNDGCDEACVRTRVVFLSSFDLYQGDFGGIAGADAACRELAAAAELERAETFKAWISDETGAPALDFHHSKGRYALVTGIPIAESWDDLTDGTLLNPITVNEHGELLPPSAVYTNTDTSGTPIDQEFSCVNWTSAMGADKTWIGLSSQTDFWWTDAVIGNPTTCGGGRHLYCFEQ